MEKGEWGAEGVKESVRVLEAAASQGAIFAPLMWPQLRGEVIAALWEAFCLVKACMGGKSKEELDEAGKVSGLINEQHTFQKPTSSGSHT